MSNIESVNLWLTGPTCAGFKRRGRISGNRGKKWRRNWKNVELFNRGVTFPWYLKEREFNVNPHVLYIWAKKLLTQPHVVWCTLLYSWKKKQRGTSTGIPTTERESKPECCLARCQTTPDYQGSMSEQERMKAWTIYRLSDHNQATEAGELRRTLATQRTNNSILTLARGRDCNTCCYTAAYIDRRTLSQNITQKPIAKHIDFLYFSSIGHTIPITFYSYHV